MDKDNNKPSNRRPLLIVIAIVAALLVCIALGFLVVQLSPGVPTSAPAPTCVSIQNNINIDMQQIQTLQTQEARASNPAQMAQISTTIAGKQQEIASFRQQARQNKCP